MLPTALLTGVRVFWVKEGEALFSPHPQLPTPPPLTLWLGAAGDFLQLPERPPVVFPWMVAPTPLGQWVDGGHMRQV